MQLQREVDVVVAGGPGFDDGSGVEGKGDAGVDGPPEGAVVEGPGQPGHGQGGVMGEVAADGDDVHCVAGAGVARQQGGVQVAAHVGYGTAAAGGPGAARAIQFYKEEIGRVMALCGCTSNEQLTPELLDYVRRS